jgi:hypothetical protein
MNLSNLIFHNFWAKLISLGLASLIWLAVHYQIKSDYVQTPTHSIHVIRKQYAGVPVSIITRPGDARVFRVSPKTALAVVDGEESILSRMTSKNVTLYVDLTDFQSRQPTNAELHVHVPVEVSVIGIQPANVTVEQISP